MKRKIGNTTPVALASAFEKRLASYGMMSLAVAGAAVVAPAAKADVIVFGTGGITTPQNGSISWDPSGGLGGTGCCAISHEGFKTGSSLFYFRANVSGQFVGSNLFGFSTLNPARLGPRAKIGPSAQFESGGYLYGIFGGNWVGGGRGFLGYRFLLGGVTHYGWAQILVQSRLSSDPGVVTLYDYGYETSANTPITTPSIPEPSSMGLLILGAAGLAAYRRKRNNG